MKKITACITKTNIILLIFIAILVAAISWVTPWLGDDVRYGFSCTPGKLDIWINSIPQIIESQNSHWFLVNGRYVAHFIVQLFVGILGRPIFSIINGIVYIIFFLILSKTANVNLKNTKTFIALAAISLLSFETKFTPSCQIGFIWTFTISLFFLNIFLRNNSRPRKWQILLLAVFSIIAGNGQEALNVGICCALVIYWAFNMRKMNEAQYIMMICFGIGTLLNCLSPGILRRSADTHISIIQSLITFICEVRAFYFLLIIVIWQHFKLNRNLISIYKSDVFYWNIWLTLILFSFVVGVQSNRQLFGEEVIAIIISFRLLNSHKINKIWIYTLCFLFISSYTLMIISDIQCYRQYESIKQQYTTSKHGIVYVDMRRPIENLAIISTPFADRLTYSKIGDTNLIFIEDYVNNYLHHNYPEKPDCLIVSPLLKGKNKKNLNNQIIPIDYGIYLIIQNKINPKVPVIKSFSRYGIHNDTITEAIDMNKDIVIETPTWKAKQYQIGALSRVTPTEQKVCFD